MYLLSEMGLKAGFSMVLMAAGLVAATDIRSAEPRSARPGTEEKAKPRTTRFGLATYYGSGFDGRETSSGEIFDKEEMVAAHPSYPAGTRARVTNVRNGRSQEVRIIDRGPTPEHQDKGVIIDVSEGVATRLGFRKKGKTRVKVEVLEWGEKTQQARLGSPR